MVKHTTGEKKKNILRKYYVHFAWQNESLKERLIKFLRRNNVFGTMSKDADCLALAQEVLNNFQPHKTAGSDPFFERALRALVNAIVFYLYFDHSPEDYEFVRVMNLLEEAREEAKRLEIGSSLALLFAKENDGKPTHTGQRELEMFLDAASRARYEIIDHIIRNFETPGGCKKMIERCKE